MSKNLFNISFSLALYVAFTSVSLAQASELPSKEELTEKIEQVKKQLPTNKEGIENAVDTAKEALSPEVRQDSPKLRMMRERVKNLHTQQADYIKRLTAGKVMPFADIKEKWQEYGTQVTNLQAPYQLFLNEEDPVRRAEFEKHLRAGLQPIGFWLEGADFDPTRPERFLLSKEQSQEIDRITSSETGPVESSKGGGLAIKVESATENYTLLHLPVPIALKTEPKVKVYLEAQGGGVFANGLPVAEFTADDKGRIFTYWVSKGESTGPGTIAITSPSSAFTEHITTNVVQLKLNPPPIWSELEAYIKQSDKNTLEEALEKVKKVKDGELPK